jgi:hypoxanthine phosphoribosyltransferase
MDAIEKTYLSANAYLSDIWRLAEGIVKSSWRPDLIVALWRGGAPVGAAVHEFMKAVGLETRHIAVKCSSYGGIGDSQGEVRFEMCEEVFASIRPGEKVLVVDDVLDTGKTASAVKARLESRGAQMRLAVVYWKPDNDLTGMSPDYFVCRRSGDWIVFPHEIDGLDDAELERKDPQLAKLVREARA